MMPGVPYEKYREEIAALLQYHGVDSSFTTRTTEWEQICIIGYCAANWLTDHSDQPPTLFQESQIRIEGLLQQVQQTLMIEGKRGQRLHQTTQEDPGKPDLA
jgi:hypothetical protein